ncbi:OmpW family outer membrane protein [Rickettsia canadensis]|uniref:OmpW family outer-membrane protein n=1 Tax=Rickettsia canadensis str. CA410 TaxID=1105107 RepID=A0ABN4A8C0_RICCA|nr:OmpW family outer membrane protein [Rickettsia canadensis]AFB20652.1 OmpW family outer-membrane protein [Rickettsia canadensis str. CA410]
MLRIVKKLGVTLLVSSISMSSFAKSMYNDIDSTEYYDSTPYYENEGSLVFKVRLGSIFSSAKQKGLPPPTSTQPVSVGEVAKNGYGGNASTTIFFNNYLATELSLGFNVLRTKYKAIANVAHNYGADTKLGKYKPIYMIPATITGQFHIAPYGGIRPYIGLGYHGSYMLTQATSLKIRNGHGAVGQIGVDFYAKDDTLINLDVKQFFLNPKLEYKPNLVGNKIVTSKVKLNPLIVSIGIGFTF